MTDVVEPTDRTRLRRHPERGDHRWPAIAAVLDEGLVAHVGVPTDDGVVVLPMAYARIERDLFLHGAPANALLRGGSGASVCVTVTLLDGLVLARSAYHHSMNYRSVVVLGRAERVDDLDTKRRALAALVDHVVTGRADDSRPPSPSELRATLVLRVPIDEASAKVRTGPPIDEAADLDLDHWAGVVPVVTSLGPPEPAPGVRAALPGYLSSTVERADDGGRVEPGDG